MIFLCVSESDAQTSGSSQENRTHTVMIKNMQFEPAQLEVVPGDTVRWVNEDIYVHDITEKNETFQSERLGKGDGFKIVIEDPIKYICSIHPTMTGAIKVVED